MAPRAYERLLDERFREVRLRGTFAPFFRASERPIAIACLRLFTLPPWPLLPRFSVPCLRRRIALSTLLLAPRLYFLPLDLRRLLFAAMTPPVEVLRSGTDRAGASMIPRLHETAHQPILQENW